MARVLKKSYQNPILYRFNEFVDYYNSTQHFLTQKIRMGKEQTGTALLLAYYNKHKEELRSLSDSDTAFLPSLFTNNVELCERINLEDNSSAYRSVRWLCKLTLPDNLGVFCTKTFHGRKNDYQIRINPFFLTGKVTLNWGISEKKAPKFANEDEKQKALEIALNSPLIAICNPPTYTKTSNYITYNTTTTPCGKVENLTSTQKQQQKQETKTKGGNSEVFGVKESPKHSIAKTKNGGAGAAPTSQTDVDNEQPKVVYQHPKKGHSRTPIQPIVRVEITQNPQNEKFERYVVGRVTQFFDYATKFLYPNYRFNDAETLRISEIIKKSWFDKQVKNFRSVEQFDKYHDYLCECVVFALEELSTRPYAYIHPDAKVFFSDKFEHGMKRATQLYLKKYQNRDRNLILTAQKSIKTFKIPRGVKSVTNIFQLVQYWKHRLETTSFNPQLTLHSFNVYLTNPKNIYKNG